MVRPISCLVFHPTSTAGQDMLCDKLRPLLRVDQDHLERREIHSVRFEDEEDTLYVILHSDDLMGFIELVKHAGDYGIINRWT